MTGLAIYFHNIPGAMMRVLGCFTRRGLVMEGVWCAPAGGRHRATVMVNAEPITIEQIVRELESTVGVDSVEALANPAAAQAAKLKSAEVLSDNGATTVKLAGPPEENRELLTLLGVAGN